jgi:hypothetical protein
MRMHENKVSADENIAIVVMVTLLIAILCSIAIRADLVLKF